MRKVNTQDFFFLWAFQQSIRSQYWLTVHIKRFVMNSFCKFMVDVFSTCKIRYVTFVMFNIEHKVKQQM